MIRPSCPVREAARTHPDSIAVVDGQFTLSYEVLDSWADSRAARLNELGVAPDDRVAIWSSNKLEVLISLVALWRIGTLSVLLPSRIPLAGLDPYLSVADANYVLTDAEHAAHFPQDGISFAELDTDRSQKPPLFEIRSDQLVTGVFTSGSSGFPKLALHTLANHYYSASGSAKNIPLRRGDRWMISLPLYHVSGLGVLFRCLFAQATVVLGQKDLSLAKSIDQFEITHISIVSTQLGRLLAAPPANISRMKCLLVGGSAVPNTLLKRAVIRKWPVFVTYGLTEMTSQVTTTQPDSSLDAILETSGNVLDHRKLAIADDGEILVGGEVLFAGYLMATTLVKPVDSDGLFHTGDLGEVDSEGNLRVLGRKDFLFISGGENIQPEEIEHAIRKEGSVQQVCVVPIPDETYGFTPVAILDTGSVPIDSVALTRRLEGTLPRFKIPTHFLPWPAQLKSSGMKINRKELVDYAASAIGQSRKA